MRSPLALLPLLVAVGCLAALYAIESDEGHPRNAATSSVIFIVGTCAALFAFGVANTACNAQLLLALPAHLQAPLQAPVQMLASIGRAVGPSLGALVIEADEEHPLRYAATILALTVGLVGLATWVPIALGKLFFTPLPQAATPRGAADIKHANAHPHPISEQGRCSQGRTQREEKVRELI